MDVELQRQRREMADLLTAQALRIALQPVMDLASGTYPTMEALARFDAPLGPPDVTFATEHRVGLRRELELLALDKAIELVPRLRPEQAVAINLSPDVAVHVASRPPAVALDRLIFELTEHAAVESYATLRCALAPLREAGLRLAVDDAGAGFSSLRHIVELQPDIIKIDRSLVAGADSDRARRTVITMFVLMALDMRATVIAEGVETVAELSCVAGLGVDQVQGYLIGRPSTQLDDIDALRPRADATSPYPDLDSPPSRPRLTRQGPATDCRQSRAADQKGPPAAEASAEALTISDLHRHGSSPLTIAAKLNSLGSRTHRNARWSSRSVIEMLRLFPVSFVDLSSERRSADETDRLLALAEDEPPSL